MTQLQWGASDREPEVHKVPPDSRVILGGGAEIGGSCAVYRGSLGDTAKTMRDNPAQCAHRQRL